MPRKKREQRYERSPISAGLRFEILTRDGYRCQYCGKKAADVVLHVDHRRPVSEGGTNDRNNLITSCEQCNLGKSDNTYSRGWQSHLNAPHSEELERIALQWEEKTGQKYPLSLRSGCSSGSGHILRALLEVFGFSVVTRAITNVELDWNCSIYKDILCGLIPFMCRQIELKDREDEDGRALSDEELRGLFR